MKPIAVSLLLGLLMTNTAWGEPATLSISAAVSIAGNQRMLSQRLGKAFLLKAFGGNEDKAQKEINNSVVLFDENLRLLREFAPTPGNKFEIEKEAKLWDEYKKIVGGVADRSSAARVMESNTALMTACGDVLSSLIQYAKTLSTTKQDDKPSSNTVIALVNTTARQRMLSQRLILYYLAYVNALGDPVNTKEIFTNVFAEFKDGLSALYTSPSNTQEISDAISEVLTAWVPLRDSLDKMLLKQMDGDDANTAANKILLQLDKVSTLYIKILE